MSFFEIQVITDPDRHLRYKWIVAEDWRKDHASAHNFATKREVQKDAEAFVDKLILAWQRSN
jgi:hypothetical protein